MDYKVTGTELTGIANAIRTKGGTSAPLTFPSGFVSAISAISGGGASPVLSSITISSNGSYTPPTGVDGFDNVVVDVPAPSGSISISQNGTYDVTSFANAVVNVSGGGGSNDNFLIAIGASTGSIYDTETSVVGKNGFARLENLTGVEMISVKTIGESAFMNCSHLSEASFPECTYIQDNAFSGCSDLSSITFPKLNSISAGAFKDTGLISLDFPSYSNRIAAYTFGQCFSLTNVNLPNATFLSNSCFRMCSTLISVNFQNITGTASYAFESCKTLPEITLPSTLSTLGEATFANCNSLSRVVLLYSSVVRIAYGNIFTNTPIIKSSYLGFFGSIYVPASLVDAYKSANYWSAYADRITAYTE